MLRPIVTATVIPATLLLLSACTPQYPKCDKDEHCKEGEYCVNGMCQQCRDSKDCPKGQQCKGGRCEAIPGYCESAADCPDGKACLNNRCVPCTKDADCGPGATCKSGRCLQPGQCLTNEDCPENHECQNGTCVAPPPSSMGGTDPCSQAGLSPLPTIYFDFDEAVLTSEATRQLQESLVCLRKVSRRTVRMEGHCDARGTEEYNLALGDRRARSVKNYLVRLGMSGGRFRSVSKGKLEATGYNEETWTKDRKVVFHWE